MPVRVKYFGGPRHGKKATLKDKEHPPAKIKAAAEAKAVNQAPGVYVHTGETVTSTEIHSDYRWVMT